MADTYEDFLKKYSDTFVILDKQVAFLTGDGDGRLVFSTKEKGNIILKGDQKTFDKVSHFFPKRGLYNIDDRAYLFYRKPERQWRRGICSKNTNIAPLFGNDFPNPNLEIIQQIFTPSYPTTIEEALKKPRFISQALSTLLGVSLSDNKTYDALLWFRSQAIGYICLKEKTILLAEKNFEEEVRDYLRNKGLSLSWNLKI